MGAINFRETRLVKCVVILLFGALFFVPASQAHELGCSGVIPAKVSDKPSDISEILRLTNAHRATVGAQALTLDPALQRAAQWKARDMASREYMEHTDRPLTAVGTSRGVGERIKDCGHEASGSSWTWAENIAWGYPSAEDVVKGWIDSPGHRANIENPALKYIGIGSAFSESPYYAQVFHSSADSSPELFLPPAEPVNGEVNATTIVDEYKDETIEGIFYPQLTTPLDPWQASVIEIDSASNDLKYNVALKNNGIELIINPNEMDNYPSNVTVTYRTRNLIGNPSLSIGTVNFIIPQSTKKLKENLLRDLKKVSVKLNKKQSLNSLIKRKTVTFQVTSPVDASKVSGGIYIPIKQAKLLRIKLTKSQEKNRFIQIGKAKPMVLRSNEPNMISFVIDKKFIASIRSAKIQKLKVKAINLRAEFLVNSEDQSTKVSRSITLR